MKIVLAPDSFKSSMSAKQASDAMANGIKQVDSSNQVEKVPMADGGEGTVDALVNNKQGVFEFVPVKDPMGHLTIAKYGLINNQSVAVIEMSAASGIQYQKDEDFNIIQANTYGTGQLIARTLDHHVKSIIIGIGGSATNDGGYGMANALGVRFLDRSHQEIEPKRLDRLASIDTSNLDPRIKNTKVKIASDVSNPLVGNDGASTVFAPQKGANDHQIKQLDANLSNYAKVIQKDLNISIADTSGAGAAGGLGAGLLVFTDAKMQSGVQLVMKMVDLEKKLKNADLVITGEGSIDSQTKYGKVPMGVAQLAKQVAPRSKVIALGGHIEHHLDEIYQKGIDAIFPIIPGAMDLDDAMKNGPSNITSIVRNIMRLLW